KYRIEAPQIRPALEMAGRVLIPQDQARTADHRPRKCRRSRAATAQNGDSQQYQTRQQDVEWPFKGPEKTANEAECAAENIPDAESEDLSEEKQDAQPNQNDCADDASGISL